MTELKLDKHPRPQTPSLWIIVLAAGVRVLAEGKQANVEFYQSRSVQYTKQEAIQAVLKQLQAEQPRLYQRGQQMGGWAITHIDQLTAEKVEQLFKECSNGEREKEKNAIEQVRNDLLNEIVTTKDVNLFHQALRDGLINDYERLYIHDKLTEGMETPETEELLKSPYM